MIRSSDHQPSAAAGGGWGLSWPPRFYPCNFCRRVFRSAQALGGHMNVHRRDRARLRNSPTSTIIFKPIESSSSTPLNLNLPTNPNLPPSCESPSSSHLGHLLPSCEFSEHPKKVLVVRKSGSLSGGDHDHGHGCHLVKLGLDIGIFGGGGDEGEDEDFEVGLDLELRLGYGR